MPREILGAFFIGSFGCTMFYMNIQKMIIGIVVFVILVGGGVWGIRAYRAHQEQLQEQAVASVVEGFGKSLQSVSLMANPEQVAREIETYYKPYLTQKLLNAWVDQPKQALGRLTSSPWPDSINIDTITKQNEGYRVEGKIIEITSVEKARGGSAATRNITLLVVQEGNSWKIASVTAQGYVQNQPVRYVNGQYRFYVDLPSSWRGYTVLQEEWHGDSPQKQDIAQGPKVILRSPQWTSSDPYQDIPIMIFTQEQWKQMQNDVFHIGAAPINPSMLGESDAYVFALPARYNFAFPRGYQEVDNIISSHPLHTF